MILAVLLMFLLKQILRWQMSAFAVVLRTSIRTRSCYGIPEEIFLKDLFHSRRDPWKYRRNHHN